MATLESQSVLIFGGSSGIGYAVAEASLKSRAAAVTIVSSDASRVAKAVARLEAVNQGKAKVRGEVVDASNLDAVKEFMARFGEVDHLVYTSGDSLLQLDKSDPGAWKKTFDVRYFGANVAAHHAKIRPGGSITLTTGSVLVKPMKGLSAVVGVAGAIDAMTRGLAVDLAPIRVNAISPGIVKTELWDSVPREQLEVMYAKEGEKLLVKHVGEAAEIAEAYLFVMKCTFITGQRIEVDGGSVLSDSSSLP